MTPQQMIDDLTARLAAADIAWATEHGDPPAEPAYVSALARQVAAHAPEYVAPPNRCPSCEHRLSNHTFEGCVQEIAHGPNDEPDVCPCAVTSPGGYLVTREVADHG